MNRRLARLQRDPHFDDARRCLGRRHSLTTGVLLDPLSSHLVLTDVTSLRPKHRLLTGLPTYLLNSPL